VTTAAPVLPTPAGTLGALTRDVSSAVAAGNLSADRGTAIEGDATQAVVDAGAGQVNRAAMDLQQAAAAIAGGAQDGSVPLSTASTSMLQADLSALANTLGLGAASTPPATVAGPPAPGHDNGGGKGH
jgi:hypothetical protein